MERSTNLLNEECIYCKDCSDAGDGAAFCTGCGRQLKPMPKGRFESRSTECSEQSARRVFGFEDAYSLSRTLGVTALRSDTPGHAQNTYGSIRSAATRAVVAIRRGIAKDIVTPIPYEARIMDAKPVVERTEWDLSTEQLQVTTLTRSCALRGRRRFRSRLRSQVQRTTLSAAKPATKRVSGAGSARKSSTKNGRVLYPSSGREHGRSRGGTRQPTKKGAQNRDGSHRKRSTLDAPRPRFPVTNKTPTNLIGESTPLLRGRAPETQEQAIAMARGGVRYRQMVFHRKGVKLTEDSPRSLRPREAFRTRGLHPLCSRGFFVAGNRKGEGQIFVATVSAVVRTMDAKPVGDDGEADTLRIDVRRLHRCPGLRLEVRPKGPLANLPDIKHVNAFDASLLPTSATRTRGTIHTYFLGNGAARDATEHPITALEDNEAGGGGSSGQLMVGSRRKYDCVGQGRPLALNRNLPHTPPLILSPRHLESGEASDPVMRPSADAIFVEDLSHEEIGALVERDVVWRDPFEEDRTIGELEDTWIACLEALCRRLRILISKAYNDRGYIPRKTEAAGLPYSEAPTTERTTEVTSSQDAQVSSYTAPPSHPAPPNAATILPKRSDERYYASPTAADINGSTGPAGDKHIPGSFSIDERDVGVRDVTADDEEAGRKYHGFMARVSFNKTLVRAGARVPWGRGKAGRFAKVLFTVSVGKACRGLDFVAVSVSSTSDPMLRGRWECHATDRDLARFLRVGCGEGTRLNLRKRFLAYDPKRCAAQLQKSGELEWVCSLLAKKAFRLVLIVPGGVSLSFAGFNEHAGEEIAWPQDLEEDRALHEASIDIQRSWRGWLSRRRTLWVRMEREGRRRLARLQEEVKHEMALEAEKKAEADRRMRAQIVLAAAARRWMARMEATRKRMEHAEEPSQDDRSVDFCGPAVEKNSKQVQAVGSYNQPQEIVAVEEGDDALNGAKLSLVPERGFARFERDVTIDGTDVHLIVDVKEVERGKGVRVKEMVLIAVDNKTRRSSTLSLAAADIRDILGPADGSASANDMTNVGGWVDDAGTQEVFTAVLKRLTVFKSHLKDLFILSYRGRRS